MYNIIDNQSIGIIWGIKEYFEYFEKKIFLNWQFNVLRDKLIL